MLVAPVLPVQPAAPPASPPESANPAADLLAARRRRLGAIVAEAEANREAAEASAGNPPPAPPAAVRFAALPTIVGTPGLSDGPAAHWTAGELCKLFGLPRVLVDALAPAGIVPAQTGNLHPGVAPGDPLYDPVHVTAALRAAGHVRAARRLERDPEHDLRFDPADLTWDELDAREAEAAAAAAPGPKDAIVAGDGKLADPYEARFKARDVRNRLFAADRRCRYCGCGIRKAGLATLDHIVPVAKGGGDDPTNLTLACQRCNTAKGDRTPEEWAAAILAAKPAAEDDALAWAVADAEWGRVALGPNAEPVPEEDDFVRLVDDPWPWQVEEDRREPVDDWTPINRLPTAADVAAKPR